MVEEYREQKPKTKAVVTFLIGNGFDIGLGLRTRYMDFLPVYLESFNGSSVIKELKSNIKKDIDSWGDAELAFGKLPFSSFSTDSHSSVNECIADFSNALSEYLRAEAMRFQTPDDKLKSIFSQGLFSYYCALGEYSKRNELARLSRFQTLKINIISFNYTEVIDKMLVQSGRMNLPDWGQVEVEISPILHVHGALSTRYSRLFGVNDISQVEDKNLNDKTKKLLVKSIIDRMAGCGLEPVAKSMIDESDSVIVFGMSLGATDRIWWNYLFDQIRSKPDKRLFLSPYVDCQRGAASLPEEAEWADIERQRFYGAVGGQEKLYVTIDQLDHRINVFIRGPYFDPDGHQVFCDPFQLSWLRQRLVPDSIMNGGAPNMNVTPHNS